MRFKIFWTVCFYGLLFCTWLVYISSGISPRYSAFWALASWCIPLLGLLQGLVCIGLLVGKRIFYACLSGSTCLFFLPFLWATYNPCGTNKIPAKLPQDAFSVLSYNVHVFNSYPILQKRNPHAASSMRAWVAKNEATIQCLQEFYLVKGSPEFDMIKQLATQRGYDFHVGSPHLLDLPTGYFGVAIFSKLPIIRRGELPFEVRDAHYQPAIWADVLRGKDTIRIINVHLESTIIHENQSKYGILVALIHGFKKRAIQVQILTDFIRKTPYKTVVAGDFNDLPYSYAYQAIKRQLYNAFEAKGAGFGFTHQGVGDYPPFLRIDNQFYGKGLECLAYQTFYAQKDSDHLPIMAVYR